MGTPGSPARLSRRSALLLGATAIPLASCALLDDGSTADPTPTAPHPDDVIRDRIVAAERELIAHYDAVVQEHPDLGPVLDPFRARHERHTAAVLNTRSTPTPGPTSTPAQPHPPAAAPLVVVPSDPAEAVDQLTDAEAAGAEARLADCLAVRDGRLAAVIAGIAAGEATHGRLLRAVES